VKHVTRALQLAQQRAASDLHYWPRKDEGSVEHQSLITAHRRYCEALKELGVEPICYMAAAVAEKRASWPEIQ